MENKNASIQIKVSEETFKGTYSNAAIISHTQGEFVLDFISVFHGKGVLSSRVIVSPGNAKHILRALGEGISSYEKKFGDIREAEGAKVDIGPIN
jgi:hypothetical protein